ncbi:MAG: hypothetical protein IKE89_05915 [Bacilli bacterium]|nr:hypothetical protein [Bacilli bacterium]
MSRGKRINISDPNDINQQELFKRLEKRIGPNAPHFLEEIRKSNDNETKVILFTIKDDEIDKMCFIHGYKDLKECDIYYSNYDLSKDTRIIEESSGYAEHFLNMINIRIHIPENDQIVDKLQEDGYELIGNIEGEDSIILLRDTLASPKKEKTPSRRKNK